MQVRQRRHVTLIEIMIVMFLISLILGVVAFNYRGTLEQGRAFRTEQSIEKLRTIILLHLAENPGDASDVESSWKTWVRRSPLARNPNDLLIDGWGEEFRVRWVDHSDGGKDVEIYSRRYEDYQRSKRGG